ncbi:MAG: dTDP-glucose 4,6-dehydratase [Acidobacteria bacterium]|nr:dTDP-glucose 4,6-dehydratase [Acidobacteriota bacterium]
MRILVTGGAGFIGSNFVRYFLSRHPDGFVVNLDKLTYAGNLENLADLEKDPRHEFLQGDICDAGLVKGLAARVEAIINFAAESHVDRSILDASSFLATNIDGTRVLLEASRQHKVHRFIQISTDEVYGSLSAGAFHEASPLAPSSPYAASKAAADLFVRAYHHTYGVPGIITRCTNNYGPYQFPEKLIPLFISNALEHKPLPLYGDGLQLRDWIHVEDHCAAIDRVLHGGRPGETYNVGARNERRNLDLARALLKILGRPDSLIQLVTDRPGHDRRYAIDPTKIERELGWRPRVSWEEGMHQTVQWYLGHRDWLDRVRSGAYRTYYRAMYEERDDTLSNLTSASSVEPNRERV